MADAEWKVLRFFLLDYLERERATSRRKMGKFRSKKAREMESERVTEMELLYDELKFGGK